MPPDELLLNCPMDDHAEPVFIDKHESLTLLAMRFASCAKVIFLSYLSLAVWTFAFSSASLAAKQRIGRPQDLGDSDSPRACGRCDTPDHRVLRHERTLKRGRQGKAMRWRNAQRFFLRVVERLAYSFDLGPNRVDGIKVDATSGSLDAASPSRFARRAKRFTGHAKLTSRDRVWGHRSTRLAGATAPVLIRRRWASAQHGIGEAPSGALKASSVPCNSLQRGLWKMRSTYAARRPDRGPHVSTHISSAVNGPLHGDERARGKLGGEQSERSGGGRHYPCVACAAVGGGHGAQRVVNFY